MTKGNEVPSSNAERGSFIGVSIPGKFREDSEESLYEIVGEFTTDPTSDITDLHPQEDGSYLVEGSANIRELNRALRIKLPTGGPKTLNGLITEFMETIPQPGTALLLEGHPVEIVQTKGTGIKMVRIRPRGKTDSHDRKAEKSSNEK